MREQGLPHSPADDSRTDLEHLVSLQSLAEDRMAEKLTVIWELEVGNSIIPDRGLPETLSADAFDEPDTLGAFVDAVRWGAVTSAGAKAYQAPFRSGATLEPYQLEPLHLALEVPRTNLLLGDDVGLGKASSWARRARRLGGTPSSASGQHSVGRRPAPSLSVWRRGRP